MTDPNNPLDQDNLRMDASFERGLLRKLKKREAQLRKSHGRKPEKRRWQLPAVGVGFASILIVVALLINTASPASVQPVLAYEIFAEVKTRPIGNLEVFESFDEEQLAEGVFVHRQTTFENGEAYLPCIYGADTDFSYADPDYVPLYAVDTLYYTNPPNIEVLFIKESGNKATPPLMIYDEDINFDRLAKVLAQDEGQFEYIRQIGTLVDAQGNELDQSAELTAEPYNTTEVYRLYVKNATKGLCQDNPEQELVELVVRVSDLSILEFNIYTGTASAETLITSTKSEFITEATGNYEDFKPTFEALGFNEAQARQNALEYNANVNLDTTGSEDIGNILSADPFTAWGTNRPEIYAEYDDPSSIHTVVFDDREDLRIYVPGIDYRFTGSHGRPIGLHGFTKSQDESGATIYIDNYVQTFQAENPQIEFGDWDAQIIADEITEFTVDGKEAIAVLIDGPFSGQEQLFYTIINTDEPNFPAVVIYEEADQHFQFEDNWQAFINSISFYQ